MPLIYRYSGDEFPQPPQIADDSGDSWWSGAQRSFASVALAAALTITAAATTVAQTLQWQDEIPGALHGQADEDLWQNPVAPVPARNAWPQPFQFDVQEPAGALYGQPDEDFWINPVAPVKGTNLAPSPWTFEQNESAGSLFGEPDEDFWSNPTRPVQASNFQPLPYGLEFTDGDIPAGNLYGQSDEDFWTNPTAPVPASLRPFTPWDCEEIPAGSLYGQPDEDFWTAKLAPGVGSMYQQLPYLFDAAEIAYPDLFAPPEEDFWANPAAPIPGANWQRLPYQPDPEEIPAANLYLGLDETDWKVPPVAQPPTVWPQPWSFQQDDVVTIPFVPDEDFAQPFIVQGQKQSAQLFTDRDDVPFYTIDEDVWTNPAFPVPPSLIYPQQWQFDTPEIATATLQIDEEPWRNPVPPIAGANVQILPYAFDGAETVSTPFMPDEDLWSVGLPKIAPSNAPLYGFATEEPQLFIAPADETFWNNSVAPSPWALYQQLPYMFDQEASPLPAIFTNWIVSLGGGSVPDQVCFKGSVTPDIVSLTGNAPEGNI